MIDALKKTLLAGVGAAIVTKEKVEVALSDLVNQGKLSASDAKALAEKIAADGRREFEEASAQISSKVHDLLNRSNETTLERLNQLEARVRALEAKADKNPAP